MDRGFLHSLRVVSEQKISASPRKHVGGGGGKSVTSCELKQPSDWKCFMALSYCCRDLRQLVTNEIIIPDGAA